MDSHHRGSVLPGSSGSGLSFSTLIARRANPTRLVLFIHGFKGHITNSWEQFLGYVSERENEFWLSSDVIFVGHESTKLSIATITDSISSVLAGLLPVPSAELTSYTDLGSTFYIRDSSTEYSEIVLVGHSMGGVIARNIVRSALRDWVFFERFGAPKDEILSGLSVARALVADARVVLFSPAQAGARPAGLLGYANSFYLAEILYAASPSFSELTKNRNLLDALRRDTERLFDLCGARALSAETLWAGRDNVVVNVDYACDRLGGTVQRASHRDVCKPNPQYLEPVELVEGNKPAGVWS